MAFESNNGIKISFECSELIEELKEDIEEFGEDTLVNVWVREDKDGVALFVNYDFIDEDMPLTEDEKKLMEEQNEHIEVMSMGTLLPILEKQNEIL